MIEAPIDGIVIQRSVDVGQTVAASMQAPTLFVIAADLTKMQVNANIDEADVGRIRPGQHVTFKVDAYPTDTFEGTVSQIRLQPVVVSNVTTYGTVIDVPNAQLKLKPGMTANVKVEIAKRTDVLRVPAAALRFRPSTDVFAALNQPVPPEALASTGGRGGRGGQGRGGAGGGDRGRATGGAGATPSTRLRRPQRRRVRHATPAHRQRRPPSGGARRRTGGAAAAAGRVRAARPGGEGRRGFDPARMMERFKGMSPDEQKQFIARMKDRGQDTSRSRRSCQGTAKACRRSRNRPRRRARDHRRVVRAAADGRIARPRVAVHGSPVEAGEPAPRHLRRHEHRAAQRRAAAEHGGRDRRHRLGTTRTLPTQPAPAIR